MNKNSLKCLLSIVLAVGTVGVTNADEEKTPPASAEANSARADASFLNQLRTAGVVDACREIGIDFDEVFVPLASSTNHDYRRYRWSVSSDENGKLQIHAYPPEEELGWTPWERWGITDGKPVHTDWVQYPIQKPDEKGLLRWYVLEQSADLTPRFLRPCADLEAQLRLARVDVVAELLGLDFKKTFIDSISKEVQDKYRQFRWTLIPHVLAADVPVIYALPPMNRSDEWPWLSWYTDGKVPQILHVHYTAETPLTTGSWSERMGAPQRPPEIYQHTWYWYDDLALLPIQLK